MLIASEEEDCCISGNAAVNEATYIEIFDSRVVIRMNKQWWQRHLAYLSTLESAVFREAKWSVLKIRIVDQTCVFPTAFTLLAHPSSISPSHHR